MGEESEDKSQTMKDHVTTRSPETLDKEQRKRMQEYAACRAHAGDLGRFTFIAATLGVYLLQEPFRTGLWTTSLIYPRKFFHVVPLATGVLSSYFVTQRARLACEDRALLDTVDEQTKRMQDYEACRTRAVDFGRFTFLTTTGSIYLVQELIKNGVWQNVLFYPRQFYHVVPWGAALVLGYLATERGKTICDDAYPIESDRKKRPWRPQQLYLEEPKSKSK